MSIKKDCTVCGGSAEEKLEQSKKVERNPKGEVRICVGEEATFIATTRGLKPRPLGRGDTARQK